ncbi:uncharacterized protein KY384_003042 [Bacidia gigantensis]|uniref:uncharacterized protein n=1 Tax=Bacidia gigantensis TaxID=2732470 RepID=UPI001D03D92B|nr:uncharacterized protein KY384_003042 [Bacidia gigantensis]KAG8531413.1 hypothetical protein KY384_003042 [Bacidia gigantensis]
MLESPPKRRKISLPESNFALHSQSHEASSIFNNHPPNSSAVTDSCNDEKSNISISAVSKQADETVAPFLAKHIPSQYARIGAHSPLIRNAKNPNTKYCYRHRPDLKCRRSANEPSMDQLQHELEDLTQADQQAIAHIWSIFSASPAKQRTLILQGILTQCCFPQLSFLSSNVRELIRIDYLTALPPEVSFRILCFLDTTSLCKAAQVSQRWRALADDDVVWHRMCEQHIDRKCVKCGWGLPLLERKKLRESKRQIQLRATGRGLNEWSPNITPYPEQTQNPHITQGDLSHVESKNNELNQGLDGDSLQFELTGPGANTGTPGDSETYFQPRTRPWKDVYKDRFMVGTNWKYGRCTTNIFRGHQNGVMTLQFDDRILVTGSYDTTIKVWDIRIGEELRTLRGHTSAVRCLQFDDTKLISGGLDNKIKIWNWRTGECLSTLLGHSGGIISLHFDSSILVTGSADNTIRIWNFDDKSASVLRGHADWVNSVKIDSPSRTVFSASDDSTVKLWDLDSKLCIKTFEGHVGQVQQIVPLSPDYVFEDSDDDVSDHDGTCTTPSATSESHAHPQLPQFTDQQPIIEPFSPHFKSGDRPLPPRYILTGALDSTIRLWDTYTAKSIRTYFGHVEGVWALAADTLRIVSGAQDRTVKVWDTKGKCERTFGGHTGPVTCIGLSDQRMCSGAEDGELLSWTKGKAESGEGCDV